MPKYGSKYTPRKSLEQIYNEYRANFTTDSYGKWPHSYQKQIERHKIESSPRNTKPEYNIGKQSETNQPSKNEIDVDKITQTIAERIESFRNFAQQDTPRQLPTIELGEKTFFFDGRLWQLRNVENPLDFIDLRELEYGSGDRLAAGAPEREEQQHEANNETRRTEHIPAEHIPAETKSASMQETHRQPGQQDTEIETEGLENITDKPDSQADIRGVEQESTGQTDIRVRRRPGFDPLETGW